MEITQSYLKQLFDYSDGNLYWKNPIGRKIKQGALVGSSHPDGYRHTSIHGKRYLNHRLIFLWVNGYLPEFIDHINNVRTDNRIENLRPASRSQNNHNAHIRKDNSSGVKGVSWDKRAKKWLVRISLNNELKYIGLYAQLEDAKQAIEQERKTLHKEYARV